MNFKLAFKNLFHVVGVEIKLYNYLNAESPLLKKLIREYNIQTVIDVGANKGQYASLLLKNGYKGKIYSFEPIEKPFSILKRRAEGKSQWQTIHFAVGSKNEDLTINVSENIVSSSIYKVGKNSLSAEPSTRIVRQENVKVTSIDSFFDDANSLKKEVLLKLDVQGFELEALKGALKTLKDIKIIQAELSFVPLYSNAPLFMEIVGFLEKQNYEIFTILPGFRDNHTGRLLQADGIFLRKD